MPRYDVTEQAERDLEAITDYTREHWGRLQAEDYLDGLEQPWPGPLRSAPVSG